MKKLLIVGGGIFFLIFLNFSFSWSQIDFQKTDYPIGTNPEYGVVVDFDQDGDLDLAVGKWLDQNISILFNNGQGDFSTKVDYADVSGCNKVLAVDLDQDGDVDIVTSHRYNSAGEVDSTVSIFKNEGSGTFSGPTVITVGNGPNAATSFDYDNDGDLDLITANWYGDDISILTNLGGETFDTPLHIPIGQIPTHVASADLDQDGDLDLAVSNRGSNTVSILFNQGDGTFASKVDYVSEVGPHYVGVCDLDQDGDLDLAVPDFDASQISVYKNQGSGTFDPAVYYSTGYRPASLAFPDLDKDGDPDIVVANYYENYFTYLENIGNGQFVFGFNQPSGERLVHPLTGDWNADGWTDLAVTNTWSYNISVFLTIPAIYGLQILPGADQFGYKASTLNVEFNLKNTGQVPDSFQVTVTDQLGWSITPSSFIVSLASSAKTLLTEGVIVPSSALVGEKNRITLTATSLSAPALSRSGSLLVTVIPSCDVSNGDLNNDRSRNLADIVYYINYIFKNGPAPYEP